MNKTDIHWTTFSANPLRYRRKSDGKVVWACVKESPGCANCYSEAIALRFDRGKLFNRKNMEELEPFLDEKELHEMLTRKTCGGVKVDGSRCFLNDMTDMFGEWVSDDLLDRMFAVMALRSGVTWQLLTKHPARMAEYLNRLAEMQSHGLAHFLGTPFAQALCLASHAAGHLLPQNAPLAVLDNWPLKNIHAGTSVEDQQRADERIPHLLRCPAAVRFLSVEPLLGPVDLDLDPKFAPTGTISRQCWPLDNTNGPRIGWVIVGGESGSGARARPCDLAWIHSVVGQCRAARVPCFVKQDSARRPGKQGRLPLDLWDIKEFPGGN